MDKKVRHILEILENDARTTPEDIASFIDMSAEEVSQEIAKLEDTGVIRHYKTIVDWDLKRLKRPAWFSATSFIRVTGRWEIIMLASSRFPTI
ncbi:MAG: Lrp/AsnC family transcriptional regulator, partial [Methanosarcina sp.]|nr:Lrp/AsnC family transcriptional regulator [Methanosarcina sp.]